MKTIFLLAACLVAFAGCTDSKTDPEKERKEMIESLRATADCLEAGRPVVKCRQLSLRGCEK